jgi:hypothetical protein
MYTAFFALNIDIIFKVEQRNATTDLLSKHSNKL